MPVPSPISAALAGAALAGLAALVASVPAAAVPSSAGPSSAATPDPLATLRGRARILLVAAPTPTDPALRAQRATFAAMERQARERDLVLREAVGTTAEARALRDAFGLDPNAFAAVLIGKDGGEKLRSDHVLGPDQLVLTIDAMPMRQAEMRRHAR